MCCPGLQALDLSRNLLGRLTARTICERLRHQAKLQSLDLHGNLFFLDGGDVASEVARLFAKGESLKTLDNRRVLLTSFLVVVKLSL